MGCALSVQLADSRGDVLPVLPGTAIVSAVEVLVSQTSHRLTAESAQTKVKLTELLPKLQLSAIEVANFD